MNLTFCDLQIKIKMNKNNMEKKDIFVIIVNLLVLFIVMYLYYIVENLKIILSTESLCVLKTTPKTDLVKENINELNFDSTTTNNNVFVRHTRSTQSVKCKFVCIQ